MGETRAVIECTGRYHEPVVKSLSEAGIFISAVNPKLIKGQKQNTLRKVKSDPADARKSLSMLLTTGQNCVNIQVWILQENNLKH